MTNPIIQRELVGLLRNGRSLAVQVGLIAALSALVLLRWPAEGQAGGEQSLGVLRVFAYGLMAGVILLSPAFPAVSLVRERRAGTSQLLLNSPLSPWDIYLGKLVGAVTFVLLLILLSLPAAAACFTMGGVSPTQLLRVYLILILLGVQYAAVGLWVSSFAASTDSALRLTYGAILCLAVLVLGPYYLFTKESLALWYLDVPGDWLRCVSPLPAMMQELDQSGLTSRGLIETGDLTLHYAIVTAVLIAGVSAWTTLRLGGWLLDKPRAAGRMTEDRSIGGRTFRRFLYLWFFDPQRREGLIGLDAWRIAMSTIGFLITAIALALLLPLAKGLWMIVAASILGAVVAFMLAAIIFQVASANAVMVKEFRSRRFGRSGWMVRLAAGCVLASLALAYFASKASGARSEQLESTSVMGGVMVLLQIGLIVLLTPSVAAGLISAERESGGWQLLQMTPLNPFAIVLGKLMSVAWTLILILVATLPGYAVMIAIDKSLTPMVVRVLTTLGLTAVFALLLSAAVSSCFKKTAAATTTAYAILIGLCAGTMLFWLGAGAPFSHGLVSMVLRLNPLAAALELIEAPGFVGYHILPYNHWVLGTGCFLCLVVLCYRTWRLTRPQ